MQLTEHDAKALLAARGIPVPSGRRCTTPDEAGSAAASLGGPAVVKAQVPAGRRGKAGGIRFAAGADEARAHAAALLGSLLGGYRVGSVRVEERLPVEREYYAAVLTDVSGAEGRPLVLFSTAGGVDVEELLASGSASLAQVHVDPCFGLHAYQARGLVQRAAAPREHADALAATLQRMYAAYWELDAELVELNPLAVTPDGRVVALDAKVRIDGNALFRHPELPARMREEEGELAALAAERGLRYVDLDGDIGIISNGAGLTMATMDLIALHGARPANFLDTGDRILHEGMADSLDIVRRRPGLKVVLINIFAGGPRCDDIAKKLVAALEGYPDWRLPLVVTLQGRLAEAGRDYLRAHPHPAVHWADDTEAAVALAVRIARGEEPRHEHPAGP